mmetsp:Transcript_61895/g.108822  ORF Transcript_61895/g.108822 Transcript_61895/m.108822 type:complete len:205 (+) Transcript_61895:486-1100(+)
MLGELFHDSVDLLSLAGKAEACEEVPNGEVEGHVREVKHLHVGVQYLQAKAIHVLSFAAQVVAHRGFVEAVLVLVEELRDGLGSHLDVPSLCQVCETSLRGNVELEDAGLQFFTQLLLLVEHVHNVVRFVGGGGVAGRIGCGRVFLRITQRIDVAGAARLSPTAAGIHRGQALGLALHVVRRRHVGQTRRGLQGLHDGHQALQP